MDNIAVTGYLPIDLIGIGGAPLMLLCLAGGLVLLGFVAGGIMLFHFRTSVLKGVAILLLALTGAGTSAWLGFDAYHDAATRNLNTNFGNKYPLLKLEDPSAVLDRYVLLSGSGENDPLKITVLNGDQKLVYRLDLSNGAAEPVLSPADNDAPNPIEFTRPGTAR